MASSEDTNLTGAEPHLAGISPTFWSHFPMTIADLQALKLVNGLNCWTSKGGSHHVPLSKCLLVGCIVNVKIRSIDEATMYVLDDGTGMVDCFAWSNESQPGQFDLPCLIPDMMPSIYNNSFGLGDVVRVFGRIKCLAAPANAEPQGGASPVWTVDVSMMERVKGTILQEESSHWDECRERAMTLLKNPSEWNSLGYLTLLGPKIQAQVLETRNLTSTNDMYSSWKVFGPSCKCELNYKEDLLYCHCQASPDPLDPSLAFRDFLLQNLMEQQSTCQTKLVFPYKSIKSDPKVRSVAISVLSETGKADAQRMVDRLVLNAFRALRRDGLLYLFDEKLDHYLLISRKWVLEPYVRQEIGPGSPSRNFINFRGAPYLSQVHNERLLYVKRCLPKI